MWSEESGRKPRSSLGTLVSPNGENNGDGEQSRVEISVTPISCASLLGVPGVVGLLGSGEASIIGQSQSATDFHYSGKYHVHCRLLRTSPVLPAQSRFKNTKRSVN